MMCALVVVVVMEFPFAFGFCKREKATPWEKPARGPTPPQNTHYTTHNHTTKNKKQVAFLLSYMVASLFMVVYDTTIDTVFLCFLVDEEVNAVDGQMLASKGLLKVIGKYEKESQDMASKMQGSSANLDDD